MSFEPAEAAVGRRARLVDVAALAVLAAAMLGGEYLASWIAAREGLAVSRGMVFEGVWVADSWERFPWADCAAMLFFMAALPVAWEAARGRGWRTVGLGAGRKALWAIAAGLAVAAAVYGLRSRAGLVRDTHPARLMILLSYFAVVAIAEEAAFRGVIQRRTRDLFGVPAALVVAAAAFTAWHGFDAPAGIIALRSVAGLVFGIAYVYTGGLAAPIVWHWALDMALAL